MRREEPATALREAIEEAAYYRWQARGAPIGDALTDWLDAEFETYMSQSQAQISQPAATAATEHAWPPHLDVDGSCVDASLGGEDFGTSECCYR